MPCSMLCVPAMTDHLDEIDALNASLKADDRELARLQKRITSRAMRLSALEVLTLFPTATVLLAEDSMGSLNYYLFEQDGTEIDDCDEISDVSIHRLDRNAPELWQDYVVDEQDGVSYAWDGRLCWPDDLQVDEASYCVVKARLSLPKMLQEEVYGPFHPDQKEG